MNVKDSILNRIGFAAVLRCVAVFVLAAGFFAGAQSTDDSASTTDYSSFQVIVDRNIFDPNRYPRMGHQPRRREGVPTFSLAGTMSYRKGMFAFFDGSSGEYQKALQKGGTIAGYTVASISFDGVKLQGSGKEINMRVGSAMRQGSDGWELTEPGDWTPTPVTEENAGQNSDETSAPPPSSSDSANDVLKRLMQRRQQDLK